MRALQLIVLSAIAILLLAIAVDLHRLAGDFQIGADIRQSLLNYTPPTRTAAPPQETHAQEVDRRAREVIAIKKQVADSAHTNREVQDRIKTLEGGK